MKIFLIMIILAVNVGLAQFKISDWRAYSSFYNINAACMDNSQNVWVATTGGVFRYSINQQKYYEYRNINNLLSIRSTEIIYDEASRKVFVGSADGFIDIYKNGEWSHNSDIYSSSQFSNKRINDIKIRNGEALIGGGFGLAVYDVEENIFKSDIQRFGNFNQATVNHIEFTEDSIWLSTNQGVAYASFNSLLNNPSSWSVYDKSDGFLADNIKKTRKIGDRLFVLDESGIYQFNNGSFELIRQGTFFSIDEINGELHSTGYSSIVNVEQNQTHIDTEYILTGMNVVDDRHYLIHTEEHGLLFATIGMSELMIPNCPVTNKFDDIDMQSDGKIWFATGDDKNGRGVLMLDGEEWTNFTKLNRDDMKSNAYRRILVTQDDEIYATGWGPGYINITPVDTGYTIQNYDTSNTGLIGIGADIGFLALGEPAEDRFGNIWIPNYAQQGTSGPVIAAIEKETDIVYVYNNPYSQNLRNYFSLAIDMNGTKWLGGYFLAGTGLLYFNDNETLQNTSDDFAGLITSSREPELLSNDQTALEVDKNGLLWIGTPTGLTVLLNPEGVIFNSDLIFRRVKLIASTFVNDIFIDELNNKWIATNDGVWVLNSDGSELIATINENNSPLPDNTVLSVFVNPNNGRAYLGTNFGLFSVETLSAEPLQEYDISAYPQPFNPQQDGEMIIDGLSDNSILKIVTVSGKFVKEIRTTGRKAIWDGRNEQGEIVSSGVYLVITQSVSNDKSGIAKIAVVNK